MTLMDEIKKAIAIASTLQEEANLRSNDLTQIYVSPDGWKDDVARSFFDYTGPVVRKMDGLLSLLRQAESACSHAAQYDAKKEENELSAIEREVASL